MSHDLAIGEIARDTGVKIPTIRYYEQIGLLPEPERAANNRRLYGANSLNRLRFIRHARELGFDIDAIRTLLDLQDQPQRSCQEADSIAKARLKDVEQRIASLNALKAELERMVVGCSHGRVEDCRVIEIVADHDQCRHHQHEMA